MPAGHSIIATPEVPAWDHSSGAFGVYVHIPFCASRCDYCSFAAWDDRNALVPRYVAAVRAELATRAQNALPAATSVFFGGGTPSLIPASQLCSILEMIELAPDCEVTVECNPETVTDELLETYAAGGVNRLSFGVQSTSDHVLAQLGRQHRHGAVTDAVTAARANGFDSFNLDLIYGGVGETPEDWRRSLAEVLELDPPHVSAYALTVEAGTPLASQPHRHPDDDDQATKYEIAEEMLSAGGLGWYEISNWAKPGHECRHNLHYWSQGDYLGVGCSAHSHASGKRWWNIRTPERYMAAIDAESSPVAAGEDLDEQTQRLEKLTLLLRTRRGVPEHALSEQDRNGVLSGLLDYNGNQAVLTLAGRLLANEVAVRLVD